MMGENRKGQFVMIDVCDISVMKPLLAEHGFHFSKSKGQNFLIAPWVPESIAAESGVDETVGVLEIGPGIGPLTQQLSRRAGKVCAVEVDERLKPILDITLADCPNVELLWGDVLKQDIPALVGQKLPGLRPMACANLPYYITSPILTALLEADYSAFTVFCQYYAQPELLFDVPAHCFLPQPKVTSAVITLRVRKQRPWEMDDPDTFFRVVRSSFAMRRKKLSNGLASGFPELGKSGAEAVIAACGFPENVRGETLGIPEFARIANEITRRRESR